MYTFGPLDGGEPFYSDGSVGLIPGSANLASSVRGMDFMVRHMHQQVGLDLPTAVRMATLTPATIIGLQDDIGSLAAGQACGPAVSRRRPQRHESVHRRRRGGARPPWRWLGDATPPIWV